MKRFITLSILPLLGLGGCATGPGTPEHLTEYEQVRYEHRADSVAEAINQTPDWFAESEVRKGYMVANATARSADMQMAIDKATLDAKRILAEKISGRVSAKVKMYAEERGMTGAFNDESSKVVISEFSDVDMTGSDITKREVMHQGDAYRAYVQVQLAANTVNRVMSKHFNKKADEAFDERVKKAYEDLESEIQVMGRKSNKG